YQGSGAGLKLAPVKASLLDGSMTGNLDIDWRHGMALRGEFDGRNLNPARITPDWQGVANFTAGGELAWAKAAPLTGKLSAVLQESRLHGQSLTGALQADFAGDHLSLARLELQGKGFDLHASGELNQRLTLAAQISDFSKLVPGAAGTLRSEGWVRWRDRRLSGAISGTGSHLTYADTRIGGANLAARLDQGGDSPLHITANLKDVVYNTYKLQAVNLLADGTLARHTVKATIRAADAEARLALAAGYQAGSWAGEISRLDGREPGGAWSMAAPTDFTISAGKFVLSPLVLTAGAAERLEVAADLGLKPLAGQARAQWAGLNLARANPYLKGLRISGSSHGEAQIGFLPDRQLTLAGEINGRGTLVGHDRSTTFQSILLTFTGNQQGLRVGVELSTADGGRVQGSYAAAAPLRLAWPEGGDLAAELSGIDLALLNPWLPPDTRLAGRLSGQAKGLLLPGQRLELDGDAVLAGGS
ncbi:MAG TPA: hypothetical protein VLA15_04250, partial [Desulfurivibrionaceae bacterium]|nr:hypothetical protein [Desulfurivibrionaceae bacterium]